MQFCCTECNVPHDLTVDLQMFGRLNLWNDNIFRIQFPEDDSWTQFGGDLKQLTGNCALSHLGLTLPFLTNLLEETPGEGSPHLAAFREAPF